MPKAQEVIVTMGRQHGVHSCSALQLDVGSSPDVVQHNTLAEVEAQAELPLLPLDQIALQLHASTGGPCLVIASMTDRQHKQASV